MRTLFFLLFLTGVSGMARTQDYVPYYNLVNEAEYQQFLGKPELALGLFQRAFAMKQIRPKAKDLYLTGKIYLDKNDREKALHYFDRAMELPDAALAYWVSRDRGYYVARLGEDGYRNLYDKAAAKEAAFASGIRPLLDSLEIYSASDRRYRRVFIDSIQPRYAKDDPRYVAWQKKMDENDFENQTRFLAFIKTNGYPGQYLTGSDGNAAIILKHIDCRLFPAFRDELRKQLSAGKVEPFHYAAMVDRIGCLCEGQSRYDSAENCTVDRETMLKNRESIGLSPYFKDPGIHPVRRRELWEPK